MKIKEKKVVTIVFSDWEHGLAQVEANKKIIAEFNRRNPDIKVIFQRPVRPVKLLAQIAGGDAPDVFYWEGSQLGVLVAKGVVADLTPFINGPDGLNLNDYFDCLVESLKYDGKIYALPTHASPPLLFYNKDIFDKYGIKYPDETWTWDKYLEVAKKLTRDTDNDGKIDIYGTFRYAELWTMARQKGLDYFNEEGTRCIVDDPRWKEIIQFYVDLVTKHKVSPLSYEQIGIAPQAFASQRIAMLVSSGWHIPEILKYGAKFRWAITLPPHFPGEEASYRYTPGAICMYSKTPHKKEAWKFMKFYMGPEGRPKFSIAESVPALISAAKSEKYLSLPPEGRDKMVEALEKGKPWHRHPLWYEYEYKIFRPALEKALLNMATVEEVIKEMVEKGNEMLKEKSSSSP